MFPSSKIPSFRNQKRVCRGQGGGGGCNFIVSFIFLLFLLFHGVGGVGR